MPLSLVSARAQPLAGAADTCRMTQSIFGSLARTRAANSPPARGCEPAALKPVTKNASWTDSTDVALIAIIEAPLYAGETAAVGFARKEAELIHIMGKLSVLESRALVSRLSYPKDGDQLAAMFMRLTADRRARLINFLADARRREALNR